MRSKLNLKLTKANRNMKNVHSDKLFKSSHVLDTVNNCFYTIN